LLPNRFAIVMMAISSPQALFVLKSMRRRLIEL
jgi:hypothetical protein